MTDTHTPPHFDEHLVAAVGGGQLHAVDERRRLLVAWRTVERGAARWNALNTTLGMIGSTTLPGNTAGVQEYDRQLIGLAATVATFALPADRTAPLFYGQILGFLQSPGTRTAEDIVGEAIDEFRLWGTDVEQLVSVLATV
jgi:hypothetical protein